MGNRLDGGWAHNEVDQLNADSGYAYDLKGALEYDPSPTDPDRTMLGYNAWDLMDEVVQYDNGSPAPRTDMVWDADEQRLRVRNVPSEATWSFLYDTAAGIPAVLFVKHIDDKEDEYLTFFVREPGGELLANFESGGAARYYHFDALGNTVLLSDGSGNATSAYAYGAWGDVLAAPASWQPYQYVGQLGYYTHTAAQGDELSIWLQLGVRFYQPEIGRFERRDPLPGKAVMPYTYADGCPMDLTDSTGYQTLLDPDPADTARDQHILACKRRMYREAGAALDNYLDGNRRNPRAFPLPTGFRWPPPRFDTGITNAVQHCLIACKIASDRCGCRDVGAWWQGRELGSMPGASEMDYSNNNEGFGCAYEKRDLTQRGQCIDCCIKKAIDGRLTVQH